MDTQDHIWHEIAVYFNLQLVWKNMKINTQQASRSHWFNSTISSFRLLHSLFIDTCWEPFTELV
jgi:hypothetical protein